MQSPIREFRKRITKKPFGIYISPKDSPVQPEKFTGYHTGVDVEYGDTPQEVPVMAIANGTVLLSRWASGYGGVIAIEHTVNNERITAIYGHVKQSSIPGVGTRVRLGQQVGILGEGGSRDTDGERKHLHFGILKGKSTNIAGYTWTKEEVAGWVDPLMVVE